MVWAKAYYIIKNIYKVKAFGGQPWSVTPHESDQTHEGEHSRRVLIGIIWHIPDRFTIDYICILIQTHSKIACERHQPPEDAVT